MSQVIGRWSDRLRSRRWPLAGTALAGCLGTAVSAAALALLLAVRLRSAAPA